MSLQQALCCILLSLGLVDVAGGQALRPHWVGNGDCFWYRRERPLGGWEFVWVEAPRGLRRVAFDHARVAGLLSRQLGRKVDAAHLPVDGLSWQPAQPRKLQLCGSKCWQLDLDSYELLEAFDERESLPVLSQPGPDSARLRPSRIRFVNRNPEEVQLSWVDAEGRLQSHARLPSGSQIDQSTFEGQYWVVEDLQRGGRLAVFQASDCPSQAVIDCPPSADPRVSPDRTRVVEVRDHNLWIREAEREWQLSHDGKSGDGYAEVDLFWSPDSTRLLALRTRKAPFKKFPAAGDELDEVAPQVFHLETRQSWSLGREWFPHPLDLHSWRWAGDSSRFTFVYRERGLKRIRLLAAEVGSQRVDCWIEENSPTFVCDGPRYFCQWLGDRELLWMSQRTGWNHLYHYDFRQGPQGRAVTQGEWVVQQVRQVDPQQSQVILDAGGLVSGRDPYASQACRTTWTEGGGYLGSPPLGRGTEGGGYLEVLTPEEGQHQWQWSPDRRFLIDSWSRPDRPWVTELRNSRGQKLCRLEVAEAPRKRLPSPFEAPGRDGKTPIFGLIYWPRSFDPGKKYPVLEHVYAGPHQSFVPKGFEAVLEQDQALADLGFVVVRADGMGGPGRSKAFHDSCYQNLGDGGFPDRLAWIRAAGRCHPQMDLSRVGLYGSSAGGANALRGLMNYPDFYKVAVADCGDHDYRRDHPEWVECWMGWPVGPAYEAQSNLCQPGGIRGKLLLMVGLRDDKVDPAQTLDMAEILRSRGSDVELYVEPEGGHCLANTPAGFQQLSRFFRKTLQGNR